MMQSTNPNQWPGPSLRAKRIGCFALTAIFIFGIFFIIRAIVYVNHAPVNVDDSIRKAMDDTLQINAGKIPEKEVPNE